MPQAKQPIETIAGEQMIGGTTWVAIHSRGADTSWLTPAEAAALGYYLIAKYDDIGTQGDQT